MQEKITELEMLIRIAERASTSRTSSETIYDFVFSPAVSGRINTLMSELGLDTDYYDPDTTCREDVRAYVSSRRDALDSVLEMSGVASR